MVYAELERSQKYLASERRRSRDTTTVRALVVMTLVLAACDTPAATRGQPSASLSTSAPATPAATPAATSSPPPSPTLQPDPTAGPGTYTSIALAYRVDIPAGWRRSACQSTRGLTRPPGTETFTSATVDEESGSDTGPAQDVVQIHVEDAAGITPLQWLESGKLGLSTATRFEAATVDGHAAARVLATDTGAVGAIVVGARGLIYALSRGIREPTPASQQAAAALMGSLHVLTDTELATARATIVSPSPPPLRSAEDVAAALARGFTQKDTGVLATVADACLTHAMEQAGGSFRATPKVLSDMQRSFANGFVATVQPAVTYETADQASALGTWQDPGRARKNVRHMIVRVGTTWYWTGWIDLAPR